MLRIEQPECYIQGPGALERLGQLTKKFGNVFFLISGNTAMKRYGAVLMESFSGLGKLVFPSMPCSACTEDVITRYLQEAEACGCEAIIGLGGGKALDTAKMVAFRRNVPMILVPTVASSDAPCSSLSIIYGEDGGVSAVECMGRHPDMVVVDSSVIAQSPPRMLVCGMGDALSTYYEARTCMEMGFPNTFGGQASQSGFGLARLCAETLFAYGSQALEDCRAQKVTSALEYIIEANTYMSTLGFECCGVSCAHALQDALSTLPDCAGYYHGELVAFGTLCLLTAEGREPEEISAVRTFCHQVGLPITLSELGLTENVEGKLASVKEIMCPSGDIAHGIPPWITPDTFLQAVLRTNREGLEHLGKTM